MSGGGGLEMFSCIWPEPAGACWECLRCEPCCGDPCNVPAGAYCLLCWCCFGWCSFSKYYASTIGQEDCAILNHCLIQCCNFCLIFNVIARHMLRDRLGVGPAKEDIMGWIGDYLMICCCGCFTMCQELRAVEVREWDWWEQTVDRGTCVLYEPFKPCGDY